MLLAPVEVELLETIGPFQGSPGHHCGQKKDVVVHMGNHSTRWLVVCVYEWGRLGIKCRALYMLDKHFMDELHLQPRAPYFICFDHVGA